MKFDLARNALRYLVKSEKITEISVPYYLCDVVRHTLFEEKCKIKFYHIDDNFMPDCDFEENEYILYPNYFGVFGRNVLDLAEKYKNLIVDNAHSYYDKPIGFACFNAGHKFGQKDSLLWIKNNNKEEDFFVDKSLAQQRKNKFTELSEKYNSQNLIKFNPGEEYFPFVYPFLAESEEKADMLAKKLQQEGKIIYRYWNPLPTNYNEYKFYSRLVPIPLF